MDWIVSLYKNRCMFCGLKILELETACTDCVDQMLTLEESNIIPQAINDTPIICGAYYEGWMQKLILQAKLHPNPKVIRWISQWILKQVPEKWKNLPVLGVPGKVYEPIHLVEQLILDFNLYGFQTYPYSVLKRNLFYFQKQKSLDQKHRNASVYTKKFKPNLWLKYFSKSLPKQVILFDDVFTTGSTLLNCMLLLKEHYGIETIGAFTIAYTQLKPKERQTMK